MNEQEALARILYDEGAWCGDCDYEGWDECGDCRQTNLLIATAILAAGYRRQSEPREVTTTDVATCGQRGWLEDDQDDDNPCVCGLPVRHDGLHACFEGCGGQWAGGTSSTDETP